MLIKVRIKLEGMGILLFQDNKGQ